MLKRLWFIANDFARHMTRKNISAFAASTAFFLFLSLMPMIILVCSILPFTPLTEANLMSLVVEIIPGTINPMIIGIISEVYDKSAGVLSVALVVTLWSAGKGMLALITGLNEINDVEENRNYIILRMVASFYTVIILVLMLISFFIIIFGNVILGFVFSKLPQLNNAIHVLLNIRFVLVMVLLVIGFSVIYAYIPGKKMKFRAQIPGAVFSAIAWSIFSWFFSMYIDKFNGLSMYGSLTTIVIVLMWLYTCIYIILIGAYINRYFKPAYQFLEGKHRKQAKQEAHPVK